MFSSVLDWGTEKVGDKTGASTPIKRDEKRVAVPNEAKGKEIEQLWPTESEFQSGEMAKPQWERKQINVKQNICSVIFRKSPLILPFVSAHLVRLRFQR